MSHTIGHLLLHMGPGIGMVFLIAWAMWRAGQLSDPRHARELPLAASNTPVEAAMKIRNVKVPLVMLTLALLMGIGVGLPIAAVVLGSQIHVTAQQLNGEEHH